MPGRAGEKLLNEFVAAEAGHDDVGYDEVNGFGVAGSKGESSFAVAGFEDVIAAGFESFADELANGLFVFDQQDGFRSAGRRRGKPERRRELRRVRRRAGNKW